jgi:multiphosphoryl transfer protein
VAVPYQAAATADAQPLTTFEQARDAVVARLHTIAERVRAEGRADEAGIFEAQAMMALDPSLAEQVRVAQAQGAALDEAITAATNGMRAMLEALDDPYLRERGADVGAIGTMLVQAAHGVTRNPLLDLPQGAIVIAPDLTPAETVELPRERLAGFVTAFGGPTGHTAILARSLGIPAVVGAGAAALDIPADTTLILDGGASLLLIDPDEAMRADYAARRAALEQARERQRALIDQPGATADGHRVALWANIGQPAEAEAARAAGAEGVGLFRTEFLFLDRAQAPDEDEQYAAYSAVLQTMDGHPVVARTLDIGGDKPLPYLATPAEANPFLGVRGLRFCMAHPALFQTQLRALLRAATHGDLWVMLPMVATLDDLAWGRAQLRLAADALAAAGVAHRADVKLGIMIETPAAAVAADHFAREADFFSIGSNDLTQYTLAADRGDGELARRYTSDHVAVWRLIQQTITAAKRANIPVGVCGDMAGHEAYAVALTGLGIDELSMAPSALLPVRERLGQTSLADAQAAGRARIE